MASDVMVSGRYGELCYVEWVLWWLVLWWVGAMVIGAMGSGWYGEGVLSCVRVVVVVGCATVSGYHGEWVLC